MKKEILIKIVVDTEKDEFANFIKLKGFDEKQEIKNGIELIGLLDIIKQQEMKKLFNNETN